ncbi:putative chitin binding protein [Phaeoacremonium minimum UCRPA7]|uniref:Putative chitin binding protein n=1 Tax=Phaeoacremonium minimum (strain UCR-PA7) TaxID=1286976 RepID=R8BMZ3_PHAM7|nr:putative chitin binding protein [Phaeoacremonium minimum UCRPA7]EOO00650.1 putative chitin binding protein [Phaeoacremonium minimum UCRPA7]
MRWSSVLIAACCGVAAAHGDHSLPNVVGRRKLPAELKFRRPHVQRTAAAAAAAAARVPVEDNGPLDKRQVGGKDGRCGSRTKLGKVPYGGLGIYDCTNEGDIALTFDDGPYEYTGDLLDKLAAYGAKATFFITGNNIGKGMINDPDLPWAGFIKRMTEEGHQVASHTWSHQNASQLTTAQLQAQMVYNEIALNDILGFFPTYMRPPFSICEKACQTILAALGYHIIYFDLDTEGYLHDDPTEIQTSKDIWDDAMANANSDTDSFLQIEHDIHYQTVYNLTDYILTSLFQNGFRSVTVGECLGDPLANWYRAGSGKIPTVSAVVARAEADVSPTLGSGPVATTSPASTGDIITTTGECGNGITCQGSRFGNCCSQYGWCGSSADHCSLGCQSDWGTCPTPPSLDGSCGNGITCLGSTFGDCCSQNGWCGSTADYCGDGCNIAWGTCAAAKPPTPTTTSVQPSATVGLRPAYGTCNEGDEEDYE